MKQDVRTVKQWKRAMVEEETRQVSHLLTKGLSVGQIAKKMRMGYRKAELAVTDVIQRWADRTLEEGHNLAVRVRQLQAVAAMALTDYGRRRTVKHSRRIMCDACLGKGFIKNKGACPICEGEGMLLVRLDEKDVPPDPAHLKTAVSCFVECAKLEGLYLERRGSREDHSQHLHQHVHVEDPYGGVPLAEKVEAADILRGVLSGENGDGRWTIKDDRGLVEGRMMPGAPERPEKGPSGASNDSGV
jgi:hypothetical protein